MADFFFVQRLSQGCTIVSHHPILSISFHIKKKFPDKSSHAVENVENTIKDPITGKVRGALYTNPFDCLWKTFKAEGIAGWYKGEFLNTL